MVGLVVGLLLDRRIVLLLLEFIVGLGRIVLAEMDTLTQILCPVLIIRFMWTFWCLENGKWIVLHC